MLIVYKKETGGIVATLDNSIDPLGILPQDDEDVLVTLVEHGGGVRNLRVDLATQTLVPKSVILFQLSKSEVVRGEPIVIELTYEGEQFGENFPLRINEETILAVPYNEPQIELTLELPGEYVLSIPDLRIHSIPQRIRVRENIQ
jgi:hypothetical protein